MPLKLTQSENASSKAQTPSNRVLAQAKFERLWLIDKESFDPFSTAEGRERAKRISSMFPKDLQNQECVDLGSGFGHFSKMLSHSLAHVTAVDIAKGALKELESDSSIKCEQDYVPHTKLPDSAYDLVLAADLIAELPENEHRLFFSELARLVKPQGTVLVSTQLDINSTGALERFLLLAETELVIESILFSYHSLYLKILQSLRRGGRPFAWLKRAFENSDLCLSSLEKVNRFFSDEEGISHVVIKAKRKPLLQPLEEPPLSEQRKAKSIIWE